MSKSAKNRTGKRLRITAFLIKEDRTRIEQFVDVAQLRQFPTNAKAGSGVLFFKGGFANEASWAKVFADVPGFDPKKAVNVSTRALYVIRESGRWFCFTFGHTRQLLDEAAVERNFGLIVSLNCGDPDAIKAIDKTNISHVALQSREQAGRDVGFDGFEFDTDVDLLKSMTAKSRAREGEEQETYSGRDSISLYTRVTLDVFPDIARRLLRAFKDTTYKTLYPWVDKISQERDPTILAKLDASLVESINFGNSAKIWMAVPEPIDWGETESFAYRMPAPNDRRAGAVQHADIDLDNWLTETRLKGKATLDSLHSRKVYQLYKDGRPSSSWRAYRCLNAELDLEDRKYILNDGDWYNVDTAYVKSVDDFYRRLPNSKLSLPNFSTKSEPRYLASVPKIDPQFALMDRKTVMIGGGRSRVEFCDLYSTTRDIVHVKQYGGSSVLSHLFSQALVSGQTFLHEATFRHEVNKLLPAHFKLADPAVDPDPSEYTICIAIMSKVAGPLEIPFFSKVSLRHAAVALRRMSFKVTKLKIER